MRVKRSARSNELSRTVLRRRRGWRAGRGRCGRCRPTCECPSSVQSFRAAVVDLRRDEEWEARRGRDGWRERRRRCGSSRRRRRGDAGRHVLPASSRRSAWCSSCRRRRAPEAAAAVAVPEEPPHRHHELCVPARRGPSCAQTGGTHRRRRLHRCAVTPLSTGGGLEAEVAQPKAGRRWWTRWCGRFRTPSAPDRPTPGGQHTAQDPVRARRRAATRPRRRPHAPADGWWCGRVGSAPAATTVAIPG